MNTHQAREPFSELEARTQDTEWEDQLLHANAATMRNEEPNIIPNENNAMTQKCQEFSRLPIGQEKWILIARFMSSQLMKFCMGFDYCVQKMIEATRLDGCYSEDLCNSIEREMLKGLQASPEYKAFKIS